MIRTGRITRKITQLLSGCEEEYSESRQHKLLLYHARFGKIIYNSPSNGGLVV